MRYRRVALASGELPRGDARCFLDSTTPWTSVERNSGRPVWILTDWSISTWETLMRQWTTYTPDGFRLVVTREHDRWSVVCGKGDRVQHELLDVALIEAIRKEADFAGHSMRREYASWTRGLADRLQRSNRESHRCAP